MTRGLVTVTDLDHIVLRCRSVDAALAWYVDVLGLEPMRVEPWRAGEVLFPSVRVNERTIIDLLERAPTAVEPSDGGALDHLCLVIEPTDLDALAASGSVDVVGGPATLFGARGDGQSLYVRDPEGTVVELRWYP